MKLTLSCFEEIVLKGFSEYSGKTEKVENYKEFIYELFGNFRRTLMFIPETSSILDASEDIPLELWKILHSWIMQNRKRLPQERNINLHSFLLRRLNVDLYSTEWLRLSKRDFI